MARVYVSIGSNIERERHVRAALDALTAHYGVLQCSTVYETAAVGFDGDNFYNLVVGFDTTERPAEVATQLRAIEDCNGRVREGARFSARTLDLDLLLYDDLILDEGRLQLPRDEIAKHAFVLKPLADIAGACRHPLIGKTIAQMWNEFPKNNASIWPVELPR
ncbi:MAG: 2-amino-4-hydroxy-6-hydroxymethyldihydropteridine diphosphokinase [Gammaproteobacteria bacterium]|nr:2-amino-4-hydroxy-6-hydroxymethyldihydropteridine diphosphokinase [Gammaproteobacteria bacterium]